MKKHINRLPALLLSILIPGSLAASAPLARFPERGLEIFASASAYPAQYMFDRCNFRGADYSSKFQDIYSSSKYYSTVSSTDTWFAGVNWNSGSIVSFSAGIGFESDWYTTIARSDGHRTGRSTRTFLIPMVQLRLNWLTREKIRIYSSGGLGTSFRIDAEKDYSNQPAEGSETHDDSFQDSQSDVHTRRALQFCPIGIRLGKSRVGYSMELGLGDIGSLLSVGISYSLSK